MPGGNNGNVGELRTHHVGWSGNSARGGEPCLVEMMGDPILIALMKSDNVHPDDLRSLIDTVSARL
ncbi:MAG: hypothetical protein OQJ99_11915 [Rhodospirillales bacterium]|nr:hypothetical protein [Rhodospirillales bacterium]MCW8951553.1 hypothetical protein [Rhodospirillales bacterium]MCW8969656.1 hypothetical protein [Rhodospirillales bacterium]